jgi:cytidine deaminase
VTDRELYEQAVVVSDRAYARYSNYRVGAVALAKDGRVFEGVNVENAAYPLGVCAERVALSRAVVEGCGPGDIEAIGITASPCGGCRQWLFEFDVERITFRNADNRIVTYGPRELLPETWDALGDSGDRPQ